MDRVVYPKLRKAVVTLHKLDLSCEISGAGSRRETPKENTELDSEDPSSENISTGSMESNVVCTDDDDLEKKIQAFSIPVKKEEKLPNLKKEVSETEKTSSEKDGSGIQESESSKSSRKRTPSTSKSDAKLKEKLSSCAKTSCEPSKPNEKPLDLNSGTESNSGMKRKKEKLNKSKAGTENDERKKLTPGKKLTVKKKEALSENAKSVSSNPKVAEGNIALEASDKEDKGKKEKNLSTTKKSQKDECRSTQKESTEASEGLRKRKVRGEDEKGIIPNKITKRKLLKSEKPVSTSDSVEKKYKKSIVIKKKLDVSKKKSFPSTLSSHRLKDKDLKLKRSTRISARDSSSKVVEKSSRIKRKPERFLESSSLDLTEKRPKLKDAQKRVSNTSEKINNSSKLKTEIKTEISKPVGRGKEKRTSTATQKQSITHSEQPTEPKNKDVKDPLDRQNIINLRGTKPASITSKEGNDLNGRVSKKLQKKGKSTGLDRDIQNNNAEVYEEGEELLEKICDILEDSGGVSDINYGTERTYLPHRLQHNMTYDHRTVTGYEESLLISQSSLFKPKMLHKNSKFPLQSKGTESYKKLWKWLHYVRLPSDMWSLYKNCDGSFVIALHISESSPFPNLLIDKCVVFKETALARVKIYGKDVDILGSKDELQTLGQVCSFLKQIHNLSLCEGRSGEEERHSNCELYTDKTVSLPYKCKSCTCS